MAFWEMLQSIMGYGYPPVDRQTDTCQNITFPVVLRTRAVNIVLRGNSNILSSSFIRVAQMPNSCKLGAYDPVL